MCETSLYVSFFPFLKKILAAPGLHCGMQALCCSAQAFSSQGARALACEDSVVAPRPVGS